MDCEDEDLEQLRRAALMTLKHPMKSQPGGGLFRPHPSNSNLIHIVPCEEDKSRQEKRDGFSKFHRSSNSEAALSASEESEEEEIKKNNEGDSSFEDLLLELTEIMEQDVQQLTPDTTYKTEKKPMSAVVDSGRGKKTMSVVNGCAGNKTMSGVADGSTRNKAVSPVVIKGSARNKVMSPVAINGSTRNKAMSAVVNGSARNKAMSPVVINGSTRNKTMSPVVISGSARNKVMSPVVINGCTKNKAMSPVVDGYTKARVSTKSNVSKPSLPVQADSSQNQPEVRYTSRVTSSRKYRYSRSPSSYRNRSPPALRYTNERFTPSRSPETPPRKQHPLSPVLQRSFLPARRGIPTNHRPFVAKRLPFRNLQRRRFRSPTKGVAPKFRRRGEVKDRSPLPERARSKSKSSSSSADSSKESSPVTQRSSLSIVSSFVLSPKRLDSDEEEEEGCSEDAGDKENGDCENVSETANGTMKRSSLERIVNRPDEDDDVLDLGLERSVEFTSSDEDSNPNEKKKTPGKHERPCLRGEQAPAVPDLDVEAKPRRKWRKIVVDSLDKAGESWESRERRRGDPASDKGFWSRKVPELRSVVRGVVKESDDDGEDMIVDLRIKHSHDKKIRRHAENSHEGSNLRIWHAALEDIIVGVKGSESDDKLSLKRSRYSHAAPQRRVVVLSSQSARQDMPSFNVTIPKDAAYEPKSSYHYQRFGRRKNYQRFRKNQC